jgi:hypothetical protein
VLCVGVFTLSHDTSWHSFWTFIVCAVVVLRVAEILSQTGEIILRRIEADTPSRVTTLGIYVIQSVVIFTIAAELVGTNGFVSDGQHPVFSDDFLCMTWNNMATIGSSYAAQTPSARLVVAGSNITSILLFAVLLVFAFSNLQSNDRSLTNGADTASLPSEHEKIDYEALLARIGRSMSHVLGATLVIAAFVGVTALVLWLIIGYCWSWFPAALVWLPQ